MIKSVGILGYGQLGQFLVDKILNDKAVAEKLKLAFVWNRTNEKLDKLPDAYKLEGSNLTEGLRILEASGQMPDIIVEASHRNILIEYGEIIIRNSDLFITSITAMADVALYNNLINSALNHSIYLPTGAAWGIQDIIKLDESGNLDKIKVSMNFGADALRLQEPLASDLNKFKEDSDLNEILLYKGDLRRLAALAPNNVNTMCCIALAAPSVGFDGLITNLLAHKNNENHIVEIECYGKNGFYTKTTRINPASKGAVTGKQTFHSFLSSLIHARGESSGKHFC